MSIKPGLVSITFRQLSPTAIIDLVRQAGLVGIEWGGDVHVPHGDVTTAELVGQQTRTAGLEVAAYGSYYRVSHKESGPFTDVLAAAVALAAPTIRVWAGRQGTADADPSYWDAVVADARQIADMAAAEGIQIAFEFHANTLTDTNDAARSLAQAVDRPNVRLYWQPPRYSSVVYNLDGIHTVTPWLDNIHIFQWNRESGDREPLALGRADWQQYLETIRQVPGERYAMLEFVEQDSPEAFLRDAAELRNWL